MTQYDAIERVAHALRYAFALETEQPPGAVRTSIQRAVVKHAQTQRVRGEDGLRRVIARTSDDIYTLLEGKIALGSTSTATASKVEPISSVLASAGLPELEGDAIIQIGTTFHFNGNTRCCHRHIVTLGSCEASGVGEDVEVESCDTEAEVLLRWRDMIL
jgi:hypothetical protein